MQTCLYLIVSALLAAYALLWVRTRRARALLANLPSNPQLPFIGNMLLIYRGGEHLFRQIDQMSVISDEKMQPFVFWIGPCPILLCHDLDDVHTITNNLIEKPYYYNFGKIWFGNGLALAPACVWKYNVKKLAGVFNTSTVEGYQSVFNAQAQTLVKKLKTKVGLEPFDVMHYLTHTTLEAICETAFDVRITDSFENEKYYQAYNRCLDLLISRGLNLLTHFDFIYNCTPAHKELVKNVKVLHHVSDTVLKKKKLEREKIKMNGPHAETKGVKFCSVLDFLLDISESDPLFTEQQIKSEVDAIIVAGQETVATTIFYTLLMIGCRPNMQNKLHEELKSIFGDSRRPVQKEDLAQMTYCEAVVYETLRLFPPLPVFMRNADKEVQLKSCTVPIGTVCAINAWGAGRSKRAWGPDAHEYRPERWLKGEPPSTAGAFLAFSYGKRSCIGKKYAITIMKTILAYCVRELEFTSDADKLKFKVDITLKAISGHLIQVKHRNQST